MVRLRHADAGAAATAAAAAAATSTREDRIVAKLARIAPATSGGHVVVRDAADGTRRVLFTNSSIVSDGLCAQDVALLGRSDP